MSAVLTEREQGFNEGLRAAIQYHEKRFTAFMAASQAFPRDEDDAEAHSLALESISVAMRSRWYADQIGAMIKLTDAEQAERDEAARRMNK